MTKSKTQADPEVTNCLVADKFTCEFTLIFFAEGGSPVFLTRNGRGEYVLLDMKEYDHMKSELGVE